MSDALELILRYVVAAGCGWLVKRGFAGLDDPSMVGAITTIAAGVIVFLAMLARGLSKSTVAYMVARLKARHKTDLVAAAADVPGVQSIVTSDHAMADAIPSQKVTAP